LKVLLLTVWKPRMGGIVTHVENLVRNSKNEFEVVTYPSWARGPVLRPLGFMVAGFLTGLRMDFDMIHAHYALPQGLLGVLLKYFKKSQLVLTLHGSDVLVLGKKKAARPLLRWVLGRCDRVIAVSEYLKSEAVRLGAEEGKVQMVYGGVHGPPEPLPRSGTGETITFIGGLVRQKGADILLEAFQGVKREVPGADLLIVGDGPEREVLEKIRTDLALEDVRFLGFVDDLEDVYRKTAVLVLPSREEGFGLVLLEAMARGIPAVATDAGGIPEVLGPEYETVVRAGDKEALAEAIIRILKDPELGEKLSREGRERAVRFSWEKMGKEVDSIYEDVVGK
jgi:glycosyltransferase involved in cell wall biosynthesis